MKYPPTLIVDASDWDELCQGGHEWQPFLAHRFLRNLERSGSASVRRGWIPHHVLLYDGLDAAEQPAAPTYASDLPWSGGWLAAGAGGLPSSPIVPDTDGKQRMCASWAPGLRGLLTCRRAGVLDGVGRREAWRAPCRALGTCMRRQAARPHAPAADL
ncbi:uncharacterized protein HaLaN_20206 [Haematococcus lacustris]|uniref:Uncharacterized protein n=1 Tax=Haematococcus lacustris TaxID=44745 RepID=A0A699ZSI6_HAELA|nr:uncharacterized protein HaLaN_20206 [Haematococcus lacustris]